MAKDDVFRVDLSELDTIVSDVQKTEDAFEALTNELEGQIKALHEVWEGLSAQAQRAAHKTWEQGMRDMRAALADLRAAARAAHGNYSAGAQSNVDMWDSLS